MVNNTPEQDGYRSIIIIKEANVPFLTDMLKWMGEEWLPENNYRTDAIMRNTGQGYYEILAKPKD